ncbi:MAG: LysM peptidoglycan-binding domain-containing protein [Patescibacteria group bacterium]
MPEEPLILRPGMNVPPVGNVQEQLNTVGYYGLAVDNIFGPRTEGACRNFQARARLPETGIVDPATWRRLFGGVPLPADVVMVPPGSVQAPPDPERLSQVSQAGYTVEINLGERLLRLIRDGVVTGPFNIAIGKPATPTPTGNFTILNKAVDPGGPFGTRWLGLTPNGIGIHGNNAPTSIGLAVSNGCIRMYNEDIEFIFPLLNVGDPVIILAGAAAPGAGIDYTVVPGDTLFSIARQFGTTVDAIKTANGLYTDVIVPGQVLFIPGPITGGPVSTYTVVPGDTLFSIAQRFGTTVSALQLTNNLPTEEIFPGQILQIPTVPLSPPPAPGPAPEPGPGTTTYTVQPGDTLVLIAQLFNTTVQRLRELNNLTSDVIFPGQVLIVPAPEEVSAPGVPLAPSPPPAQGLQIPGVAPAPGTTYIVQPGDTLFSIAARFGTTILELARLNFLTTSEIFPGQVLRVA